MSSFSDKVKSNSMPQPPLLHLFQTEVPQPPITPADDQPPPPQFQPPVTPADDQPPPQSHSPVPPPQPKLEAPPSDTPAPAKPVVPLYKNSLQEYTQKQGLPLPAYATAFNGALHSPMFRSTVVVNDVSYTSENFFPTRKAAEMDAARVALLDVLQQQEEEEEEEDDDDCSIGQEELTLCKATLKEYADKINAKNPDYKTEDGDGSGFTSFVTFNGKQYVGDKGRNKKESQHLAARAVIMSILDSDARGVISKIIKSKKKKMICLAKGKVNNLCTEQNVGQPAAIQPISNVGISGSNEPAIGSDNMVKTGTQEPCTGNSSCVSAEPVSLIKASAIPNLELLLGGSTSSKKRKRKSEKAENNAGVDAQVQVAAVPSNENTTSIV